MPDLKHPLHTRMLREAKKSNQPENDGMYGLHWGDPNVVPYLRFVRDNYVYRFISPDQEVAPVV